MRRLLAALGSLLVLSVFVLDAAAERPIQPKDDAALVAVATIREIYTAENPYGGDGVMTSYVASLTVDQVEKGKGPQTGEVLYAHWSRVTKAPSKPIPGASGHNYAVKAGDKVRVYLVRNKDGAYAVIYNPDGIEKVEKPK